MKFEIPKFGPRRVERGYRAIPITSNELSHRSKMIGGFLILTCLNTVVLVILNRLVIPPGDLSGIMTIVKFVMMFFAALGELLVAGRFIVFLISEL